MGRIRTRVIKLPLTIYILALPQIEVLGFTSTLYTQTAMVRLILLTSIATVVFLLSSVPVQGRVALQSRGLRGFTIFTIFLEVITGLWAAFGIAIIATIFLGILLLFSIRAFCMHRIKQPHYLFSEEPVGDARTGQVFCTLVVLSLFLLTAYFPLFMTFIVIASQDSVTFPFFTNTLTYMVIDLGDALAVGALLALISHRRYLHFGKEEKMLWKKILDLAIVAFMIIFIIIWTVVYCLPSLSFEFNSNTVTISNVGAAMSHLITTFYALPIVDIFVSAEFLRRKLWEARIHDQVRKP